jgi:hypothetical protein
MSIEEAQTLPLKEEEKKPAVRHSWYQNDNFVCITFFVRERTDKDVAIKIGTKTVRATLEPSLHLPCMLTHLHHDLARCRHQIA